MNAQKIIPLIKASLTGRVINLLFAVFLLQLNFFLGCNYCFFISIKIAEKYKPFKHL